MDFRLLGSLEVWDGERQLELGGPKRRAVLAFLLLHANEVVGVDRLVDQLWGAKAPRNAAAALHTHVSRLRKELGPEVVARRTWGYVLRTEPDAIDLERFERLVADAENLPARERAEKLRAALTLWRGPPLEDLAFEPALAKDIARLEELRLIVLENRIDADLEAGNHNGLVGEVELLIAQHPLRERLRGQLILTLYRCGRQAEALEVYRETWRVLTEELGLEPSPALKELERAILRQDPSLDASAPPSDREPPPLAPQPKRRRVPLIAILALLALGLAGTATSIALVKQQQSASTGPTTGAIPHTLPPTASQPAVDEKTTTGKSHTATQRQTAVKPTTAAWGHPISSAAKTRSMTAPSRPSTAVARKLHKRHTKVAPPPKPVTIADDFSDPTLDPVIWTSWSAGTGSSYAQVNGQGVFSIAGNATFDSQFHGAGSNIGTKCKFPGNFDARVDFTLLQWPAVNGASISLNAYLASPVELISRVTAPWGDGYNAWPRGGGVMPLRDQSGSLRMTRSHGIVRVFFLHHDQWKELGRIPISGQIWVGVSIGTFQKDWQQEDVSAAVDNFVLKAPDTDCPAGSDPRNR